MYCPNCAKENAAEQKFCRNCGLNLEASAESLREQLSQADFISATKISKFFETLGKLGFGGLFGVLLVGIALLINLLINKFLLSGQTDKIIIGILLLVFLFSAILALAYVIFQEHLKEKRKGANPIMQNEIAAKDTAKLLEEKPFEPISSVTENTTNLLFVESKIKTSGELK